LDFLVICAVFVALFPRHLCFPRFISSLCNVYFLVAFACSRDCRLNTKTMRAASFFPRGCAAAVCGGGGSAAAAAAAGNPLSRYNKVTKPPFQDLQKHFYDGDSGITVCSYVYPTFG
jgi:hypothetical protein